MDKPVPGSARISPGFSSAQFLEFAKKTKIVNLDVSIQTVMENAGVIEPDPGSLLSWYVLFGGGCCLVVLKEPPQEIPIEEIHKEHLPG